jgi:hypothetical protein
LSRIASLDGLDVVDGIAGTSHQRFSLKEIEMKYSDMVYRCPGPHQRPGGTFEFKGVVSTAEHEEARQAGWFDTLPEAIAGKASLKELPPDELPPTRGELEQKARELNIKFDKKLSDEALGKKIADVLGA